jgi:hypothetical protein
LFSLALALALALAFALALAKHKIGCGTQVPACIGMDFDPIYEM